jgi:ribosome biogenesis GTPase
MSSDQSQETPLVGTVVAVQANYYQVRLDAARRDPPLSPLSKGGKEEAGGNSSLFLLCTRRSRLKKIGQQVMVGDRVVVEKLIGAGVEVRSPMYCLAKLRWIVRQLPMPSKFS